LPISLTRCNELRNRVQYGSSNLGDHQFANQEILNPLPMRNVECDELFVTNFIIFIYI